jgi:NTP pyrophosphatase (non-canonical NTP hydrolase)
MKIIKLEEIADKVIKYQKLEKNTLKVVEETTELNEVLIKRLTKQPEDAPPLDKVIEEMGDVMTRCFILARQLKITEQVQERMFFKMKQLDEWMSKRYEGVV